MGSPVCPQEAHETRCFRGQNQPKPQQKKSTAAAYPEPRRGSHRRSRRRAVGREKTSLALLRGAADGCRRADGRRGRLPSLLVLILLRVPRGAIAVVPRRRRRGEAAAHGGAGGAAEGEEARPPRPRHRGRVRRAVRGGVRRRAHGACTLLISIFFFLNRQGIIGTLSVNDSNIMVNFL